MHRLGYPDRVGRRRRGPELRQQAAYVAMWEDARMPDLFVRVEQANDGLTHVFMSEATLRTVTVDWPTQKHFLAHMRAVGGGLALAGPVYDRAALLTGTARRLRAV